MTQPVLLDVDTGVDDALAILFAVAHPEIDLLGITCVAGNTSLENVVANTLRVLDVADAPPVPVAGGALRPLIETPRASHVHGSDGLGELSTHPDFAHPRSTRAADPRHAVDLIRDVLLASTAPVTIVALAPQTNLALLLRQHPELAPRIDRILFMGGSAGVGNATPVAEFNVWHDPEAAAIVIDSGVPTFMYGLDVFNQVTIGRTDADALVASPRASARFAGRLLQFPMGDDPDAPDAATTDAAFATADARYTGHIGDAGALCALVDPGALRIERHPVRVELAGFARGQTIVDRRRRAGEDAIHAPGERAGSAGALPGPALVDVALDVDRARYARLFLDTIARLP
ncbi:nucleoside hydrolase [Herbiconiux ginsengi]|uniref:Pyrimidine-specific ribonucleoside hydrolase n=1 Tax=Herbiconiux ginsengi TaxID=381665 RepID=A0A1H3MBP5_9MICO|nr:nucleoside hydrolase [Herbiconiux ginsengi]SDY74003.1 pyrimidine-specific ribonucleoside hydrolase [Herbiconiux ginsengi]